jgi:hypothetical protein
MRRISLLLLLACLAFPAAALAGATAAGDGSLDVSGPGPSGGANGAISLTGKGVVFGYVAHGTITVYGYKPDGNSVPNVSGAKMTLSNGASSVVYSGNAMRFLFPGGRYKLEIDGMDIDISAVGNGNVTGTGVGTLAADTVVLALGAAPASASWGSAGASK